MRSFWLSGIVLAALAMSCDQAKPCVDDLGCAAGLICKSGYCGPGERGPDGGSANAGDGGVEDAGSIELPHVISTSPEDKAMRVPVGMPLDIVITFSESIRTDSLRVMVRAAPDAGPDVPIDRTLWSNENKTASLTSHAGPDYFDTPYTVTVSATAASGVVMTPYVFTFRTDLGPASVVSWIPGPVTNAEPTTRLSVTFERPMNTASVTVETLPPIDQGTPVWSNVDQTVTWPMPASDWALNTQYRIGIDAMDKEGRNTGAIRYFTTRP